MSLTSRLRRHSVAMLLLVLSSLVGISLLVPSVAAIKCHQCNSVRDDGCHDVETNSTYLKSCKEEGRAESEAFCRKMVQKVLLDGSKRVIRSCGWERSRQPCYSNDDEDHSELVCECSEEGCNSAPGRMAALLSLCSLAAALMARL